jgi:hypothetical protein
MMTLALSISLEPHLLMPLEASFTIVMCLYYSGLYYKSFTIVNLRFSLEHHLQSQLTTLAKARIS